MNVDHPTSQNIQTGVPVLRTTAKLSAVRVIKRAVSEHGGLEGDVCELI